MKDPVTLKACLDKLAVDYDARFINTDPVGLVHRFDDPADIEVAGFIVSCISSSPGDCLSCMLRDACREAR